MEGLENYNYKPLPDSVRLKKSKIHGMGLFAQRPIPKDTELGVTHLHARHYGDDVIIRTPLGGFINHSTDPNCTLLWDKYYENWTLRAVKPIRGGLEITLNYFDYPEIANSSTF